MKSKWRTVTALALAAWGCSGCSWNNPFTKPADPAAFAGGQASESTLSKAWKQTASAMTPKPGVKPSDDPTLLSSKPVKPTAELHLVAARQYESQGMMLQAEEHYRKAIELNPRDLNIQIGLARLLHREEKVDQAIAAYRSVLSQDPKSAVAWNDLGLCLARHGQVEEARKALTSAVEVRPTSALYRNNLAAVLVELHRDQEALVHLAAVHGEAGACYNLGQLFQQQGNAQQAAVYLARAAELDPAYAARMASRPTSPTLDTIQRTPGGAATPANAAIRGSAGGVTIGPELAGRSPLAGEFKVGEAASAPSPYQASKPEPPTMPLTGNDLSGDRPVLLPPIQN